MVTQLRFISLGKGHVVQANNIYAVVRPNTANNHRILAKAKTDGHYWDWTCGKPTKAIVIMDDGLVIASFFSVQTILGRLEKVFTYDVRNENSNDEDEEDEGGVYV